MKRAPFRKHQAIAGRRWRLCLWTIVLILALCGGLMGIGVGPAAGVPDETGQRIAIYRFMADGTTKLPHSDFLSDWISQSLAEYLSEEKSLTILERQNIDALLGELQLGSSELADADTRLRLGRLLEVDYFVFGSYLPVGDRLLISAHLVSTASGVVIQSADSDGDYLQVKPIVQRLSLKLLNRLGQRAAAETLRSAGSGSGKAIRALYEKGRQLEEKGDTPAALDQYREILKREADNPWAQEAIGRLAPNTVPAGTASAACPGGKRRVFIVSAIENHVEETGWDNRLIAVGLVNLINEELFATGCYLPADTDSQTRQMIQDLVVDSWSGKQPPTVIGRPAGKDLSYDTEVRLIVKSFKKSRSRLMLGPFSQGKVTIRVDVELILKQSNGTVRRASGTGEGVTRSKGVVFKIRDDKVHFDESSVGIAVHEAIKSAVKKGMEPS